MEPVWNVPQTVQPGAKERIEARLKKLPEINANRPCKTCIHNNDKSRVTIVPTSSGCSKCNFNHDNYTPIKSPKSTTKL